MSKRSKKFKGKIRACQGVARTGGVIAAASIALVSKSYGVAVRYQVNDHIPPGGQQGYDVDQDGVEDVSFDTLIDPTGVQMEAEKRAYGGGEVTCYVFVNQDSVTVKGFAAGDLVGYQLGNYLTESGLLNLFDDGPFYNQPEPRYAGFFFVGPDSLRHNAWAELRVTGSFAEGYGLDVIAFGYETEGDIPLQAGLPYIPIPTKSVSWGQIKAMYGE